MEQSPTCVHPAGSEEIRAQTGRIFSSTGFRNSPSQHRLLHFLIEESLGGRAALLTEYVIAEAVFNRSHDFDPQADSIVRVQMSILRKKLAAYYGGEGGDDTLLIAIPKGGYEPAFNIRQPAAAEPVAPPFSEGPIFPEKTQPRRWPYASRGLLLGLSLGVLFGIVLAYAGLRWIPGTPSAGKIETASATGSGVSEWRNHPLWQGFVGSGANTKLVIGAPLLLAVGEGQIVRDTLVNSEEELAASKRLQRFATEKGVKARPIELYTGLGEAAGISLLDRFFQSSGQNLPLIRNRLTKWRDLTASNVIFLSSLRFRTLGQELQRPSDFEFTQTSGVGQTLKNLRQQEGENATYSPWMADGNSGFDYALVTVWPGTSPGRRIMAVGGSYTWGTEGAAEYITDPECLRELREKLKHPESSPARTTLQVLLKVVVKDAQVVSTDYVTHHWVQ